ncbi:UDP-N-acetylglucosamine 2-epimerase [Candidatus Thioglobus autotrophicus]|uniref:UDP-N-acetylglucosamine 2-epimerase n=1 Tax=Candidatus Thioglobus autotrophicus TaxID=1705394 RepID=UPI00299E7B4E|nr:UDP-N-acetylglucosamine 2-epimerase [Candidatus Thioglobus autotrophicus]WPE15951.1 UDP-N-acetylglucosamine 2-epimerase [Candidatus Thioglobus autotrophicus]
MKVIRKICVVLVDRANYGRMFPVMRAIEIDQDLELMTICAGTMLLERFGKAETNVINDGFSISGRVYLEVEGAVPITMAKSVGMGVIEFTTEFHRLKPDIVLLIGDRYEALSAAISASYMNIAIAHIQGGEVSGSIDESARHAITKLSHLHFPSTDRASQYIRKMGEKKGNIFNVGCPSGDYILSLDNKLQHDIFNNSGVGANIDPNLPFLLVIYHPVTTRYGTEKKQVKELIDALSDLAYPTIWIWPNIDAGSNDITKVIRTYRENNKSDWLQLIKNLDPVTFQKCLKKTVCAIGNSSSFVRDSTFSGTPVVLIGDRQIGREHGDNLIHVDSIKNDILEAVNKQIKYGRYSKSELYGNGRSSNKIVKHLKNYKHEAQKVLQYIYE